MNTFYVHPADFGLPKAPLAALAGGDAEENARLARSVLGGAGGAPRDVVLLNAGACLFIAGVAIDVKQGVKEAANAIDSGRAADVLDRLVRASHDGAPT